MLSKQLLIAASAVVALQNTGGTWCWEVEVVLGGAGLLPKCRGDAYVSDGAVKLQSTRPSLGTSAGGWEAGGLLA